MRYSLNRLFVIVVAAVIMSWPHLVLADIHGDLGPVSLTVSTTTNLVVDVDVEFPTTTEMNARVSSETSDRKAADVLIRLDQSTGFFLADAGRLNNLTTSFLDTFDETNGIISVNTNVNFNQIEHRWESPALGGLPIPTYFWKFNDSNATDVVIDTIGVLNGKLAVTIGAVSRNTEDFSTNGIIDKAINDKQDGIATLLTVKPEAFIGDAGGFSISMWVQLDDGQSATGEDFLFGYFDATNPELSIEVLVNGRLFARVQDADGHVVLTQVTSPIFANGFNAFKHVVFIADFEGVGTFYIDGTAAASYLDRQSFVTQLFDFTDVAGGSNMIVGGGVRWGFPSTRFHRGAVDNYRFYLGEQLTSDQVTILYNGGAGSDETTPGGTNEVAEFKTTDLPLISYIPTNGSVIVWASDVAGDVLQTGDILAFISDDGGTNETQVTLTKNLNPTVGSGKIFSFTGLGAFPGIDSNIQLRVVFTTNTPIWYYNGYDLGYTDQ